MKQKKLDETSQKTTKQQHEFDDIKKNNNVMKPKTNQQQNNMKLMKPTKRDETKATTNKTKMTVRTACQKS